jgi:hypothetical protein
VKPTLANYGQGHERQNNAVAQLECFLVMWNRRIMWLLTLDHSLPFAIY